MRSAAGVSATRHASAGQRYLLRRQKTDGAPSCHTLYVYEYLSSYRHFKSPRNASRKFEFHAGNRNISCCYNKRDRNPGNASQRNITKVWLQFIQEYPEEWEEADYLLSSVTSSVFQASTAEEKNNCLCASIYNIISYRFGIRAPPQPQKPSIRQHDRR